MCLVLLNFTQNEQYKGQYIWTITCNMKRKRDF
jgi:hypothetical protein